MKPITMMIVGIGLTLIAAAAAVLGLVVGLVYSIDDQWPPTP